MAHDRIEMRPGVMGGKPVIRGTRMPVEILVRECAHGSPEEVAGHYPRISVEDVKAALFYAADMLRTQWLANRTGAEEARAES